jgi:hypothetical protein
MTRRYCSGATTTSAVCMAVPPVKGSTTPVRTTRTTQSTSSSNRLVVLANQTRATPAVGAISETGGAPSSPLTTR